MRASRLLSLLLLLQARGRLTAAELSRELDVSVRTVYRDVEALSHAGFPVYADRGPTGGYQLVDGYRTRLTGLTAAEASSLFLAGLPGPAAELGLGEVAAAAELKVLAALPPHPRSHAARMRERFHFDVPGWYRGDDTPFLAEIADAVWEERPLRVRYRRWGPQEVDRDIDPYGLVLKGGTWYLAGRAEGTFRTYRVSRVLAVRPLPGRFERVEFDLVAFWREFAAAFAARMYPGTALVRLAPGAESLLRHTLGADAADAALASAVPCADGWSRVSVPIESPRHACWQLLRLGADLEVLEPAELREQMITAVGELSRLYG